MQVKLWEPLAEEDQVACLDAQSVASFSFFLPLQCLLVISV